MLNKSLCIGLACAGLSVAAIADDGKNAILDGNEVTIYENFAIQEGGSKSDEDKLGVNGIGQEVISDLRNDLRAVKSDANNGSFVALVVAKDNNLPTYAINSEIRYVCKSNANNCIPDGMTAERIGTSQIYKVTVSNFAEWQNAMNVLKQSDFVKKVYPSYDYGYKNVAY